MLSRPLLATLRRQWTSCLRAVMGGAAEDGREYGSALANIRTAAPGSAEAKESEAALQSLRHDVGNHLALVSSMLALQSRMSDSEEVRRALQMAQTRIRVIANALQMERIGEGVGLVDARRLVERLVDDLSQIAQSDRIRLDVDVLDVHLKLDEAVSFMLIINELAINSIEHAFPDETPGRIGIRMSLASDPPGPSLVLVVEDDGVGRRHARSRTGLGGRVVAATAGSLGATFVEEAGWADGGRRGLRSTIIKPLR